MQVLDPTDERKPLRRQLARRSGSIDGPIGLIDISKPRGDVLLERLEQRLRERLPGVEVRRYRKPTFTKPAPDDLRRAVLLECAYVIEALAD